MDIKYVNVCLDKQDYLEKLFSNKNNKHDTDVSDVHYRTAKRLVVLPIIMLLCMAFFNVVLGIQITTLTVLMYVYWIIREICLLRQYLRIAKQREIRIVQNELNNIYKDTMVESLGFDEVVKQRELMSKNDVSKLIWIIYNTKINMIKYIDNAITVYYTYLGNKLCFAVHDFITGEGNNFNTMSVTKDDVFLRHYDAPLSHAIKSVVLPEYDEVK